MFEIARVCMDCGNMYGCKENTVNGQEVECGNCQNLPERSECLAKPHFQTEGLCVPCETIRFEAMEVACG